jgi:predicted transcriptional regulator
MSKFEKISSVLSLQSIKNKIKPKIKGFNQIGRSFTISKKYNPYAKAIFGVLVTHKMKKDECYPTETTIAKEANCSLTTAKKYINLLEKDGIIYKRKTQGYRNNIYGFKQSPRDL